MEAVRAVKKQRVDPEGNAGEDLKKTKACTKFFSLNGCPYWSKCNFLHTLPPGVNSVPTAVSSNVIIEAKRKTKLCNKFNTPEGCPFGDKCNFAHGDKELNVDRPSQVFCTTNPMAGPPQSGVIGMYGGGGGGGRRDQRVEGVGDTTATATMPVKTEAVGAVIGKGGCNIKQIMQQSGATVKFVGEDNTEAATRPLEMCGTLDQIQVAQQMVNNFVSMFNSTGGNRKVESAKTRPNFKTKLCDNWVKTGSCTYAQRCHFAHGEDELRPWTGPQAQC